MTTTPAPAGTIEGLHPRLAEYARKLIAAGVTVYTGEVKHPGDLTSEFLHYSVTRHKLGELTRSYGTVSLPEFPLLDSQLDHRMPITPSRENGSAILVQGTSNLDGNDPDVAFKVARPENWSEVKSQPGRFRNAEPWGIGTRYLPVAVEAVLT